MHSLVYAHSCMHSSAFICIRLHSFAFVCIRMHMYAFACILMPAAAERSSPASTASWCSRTGSPSSSPARWHVVAHGCSYGTPYGTPTARPAHIRPCEFGLESARLLLCKYVWSLVYSGAFLRILTHSYAFMCILKHHEASKIAPRRSSKSGIFPPKCTGIHNNASECITDRMQHIQNAPSWECIGMR